MHLNKIYSNIQIHCLMNDLTGLEVMMPPGLSCNDTEKKIHMNSIEMLAKEFKRPMEEVGRIYAVILKEFQNHARVKGFLHIIVSKRIKNILEP